MRIRRRRRRRHEPDLIQKLRTTPYRNPLKKRDLSRRANLITHRSGREDHRRLTLEPGGIGIPTPNPRHHSRITNSPNTRPRPSRHRIQHRHAYRLIVNKDIVSIRCGFNFDPLLIAATDPASPILAACAVVALKHFRNFAYDRRNILVVQHQAIWFVRTRRRELLIPPPCQTTRKHQHHNRQRHHKRRPQTINQAPPAIRIRRQDSNPPQSSSFPKPARTPSLNWISRSAAGTSGLSIQWLNCFL